MFAFQPQYQYWGSVGTLLKLVLGYCGVICLPENTSSQMEPSRLDALVVTTTGGCHLGRVMGDKGLAVEHTVTLLHCNQMGGKDISGTQIIWLPCLWQKGSKLPELFGWVPVSFLCTDLGSRKQFIVLIVLNYTVSTAAQHTSPVLMYVLYHNTCISHFTYKAEVLAKTRWLCGMIAARPSWAQVLPRMEHLALCLAKPRGNATDARHRSLPTRPPSASAFKASFNNFASYNEACLVMFLLVICNGS